MASVSLISRLTRLARPEPAFAHRVGETSGGLFEHGREGRLAAEQVGARGGFEYRCAPRVGYPAGLARGLNEWGILPWS